MKKSWNRIKRIEAQCNGCPLGQNKPFKKRDWSWEFFASEKILSIIKTQRNWSGKKCFYKIKVIYEK